jgi:HTH-type transcriptional regulator, transcriptional repressor of NAD biosynthesis genes
MNTGLPLVVCFFGPESTGKTTMAGIIARKFNARWVPEVSREMIDSNAFTLQDIERIGEAQLKRMQEATKSTEQLVICDTDLITTAVYSQHYLGTVPENINELEKIQKIDRYFLFDIDVPWVADGLRDLGNQRELMFTTFRDALEQRKIPYTLVRGNYLEREQFLTMEIEGMLANARPH